MELWIRSQDKERLGTIERIEYAADDYGHHLMGWQDKYSGSKIATYTTKERALEVLDEIQSIICGKFATSIDIKLSLNSFKPEEIQNLLEQMAVYEMPEE